MSSKEVKIALKAAKIAIQSKDYATALQHCDLILKKDAGNYNALVFAGLCFSETGEIEKARERYREAITSQPDQILAFQGLANLYTKHLKRRKTEEEIQELIPVYEKLLKSCDRKDAKRRIEIFLNFCDVLVEAGNLVKALENIKTELKAFETQDDNVKSPLYEEVFKVLGKVTTWSEMEIFSELIDESFKSVTQPESMNDKAVSHLQFYLKHLQCNSASLKEKIPRVLDVCTELSHFPNEVLPLEIMAQAYIQNCDHSTLGDIDTILTKLNNLRSNFAHIGSAFQDYKSGNIEAAHKKLDSVMAECSTFLPGWVILSQMCSKLHKYTDTRRFAKKGLLEHKQIMNGSKPTWLLPLVSLDEIKFDLSKCLATGLTHSHIEEDILTGIGTFRKLISSCPEDVSLHVGISEGLVNLGQHSEALEALNEAVLVQDNNTDVLAWRAYINSKTNSEDEISQLEAIVPPSALSLFLLGKCMWEAGGKYRTDKKNCFTALVKAAKLDPHRGEIFFLLGQFYSKVQHDTARAKGCYQKAYQMDPQHQEAAACLADAYVEDGDTQSAIKLYEDITKEVGSAGGKWVWLRLGLYKLKAKDITKAIQCFLSALRIDANDSICWECLGEGYLQRGSYTAAWKAFDKAHQINPHSVYSLYQMAKLKQVQGIYPEAIAEYADVLDLFPDYVPALQGLGESELLLACQMFHEGRFQTGIEHSEKAIKHMTRACHLRRDLCCLWKLLGDCCALVRSLDGSIVQMTIPAVLLTQKGVNATDPMEFVKVGKPELLTLSGRFYSRAVQLQPENASLWHDLGVSYFRQAENSQIQSEGTDFGKKAMNAIKKAITLEPPNNVFWCSLGTVAASQYINEPALAQHCFSTSIKNERNNVTAWSNLATLYLANDHVKQAHEAFKVAQSLEPSFVNSWIGQAIIAETIGSNETMDLYRHSTELGLQKQGAAGYCSWVTKIIANSADHDSAIFKENIRDMNAVTMATTQMSKMCDKNPRCLWSSTAHGILLEHSGLNRSAEKAYRLAYSALKDVSDGNEDEKSLAERRKKACINLARVLCKNGKFDEAISFYKQAGSTLDVYETCELALAFFKSAQFDKALETYEQAGQLTTNEEEKAQIMVAMAITQWKTGNSDEAKTLLYQCFQTCKPGLQALMSLGIAALDKTLVGAAVGELIKKKSTNLDERDVADDCLLITTAAELCGDSKMALKEVQKALHENPSSWSIRHLLCRLLVDLDGCHGVRSTPLISNQAEKLFEQHCVLNPLHRDSEFWKAPTRIEDGVRVQQACALSYVAAENHRPVSDLSLDSRKRLLRAQMFAHMHPYEASSWRLLSCACHANDVTNWTQGQQPQKGNLASTLANSSVCRCETDDHNRNVQWAGNISTWSDVLNQTELKPNEKVNVDSKFIGLLYEASKTRDKAKLQSVFKDITTVIGNTSKPDHSSRYFAELLEQLSMFQVSRKMYEKCIALTETNNVEKMSTYFRLLRLSYNLATKDESKVKEMGAVVKSLIADVLTVDPRSPQSLLCQGLAARMEKNHRKSKSFFSRVVNSTEFISDSTRTAAIWYLYRTLHERNDSTEVQKLVDKAIDMEDPNISTLIELLPVS